MDGRLARRLNNPEKTPTKRNKHHATLEGANKSKISGICREKRPRRKPYAHYQRRDFPNFLLLPWLSEWAALAFVPFSKLGKGLLLEASLVSFKWQDRGWYNCWWNRILHCCEWCIALFSHLFSLASVKLRISICEMSEMTSLYMKSFRFHLNEDRASTSLCRMCWCSQH